MVDGTLHFWRRSAETLARHRNPIFGASVGITQESVVPCWLHGMSLGTFKLVIIHIFWKLQKINYWDVRQSPEEAMLEASLPVMQRALFKWYNCEAAANRNHCRVQRLTVGMFGSSKHPACGLHGAETNGVLCFLASVLDICGARLPDPIRTRRLLDTAIEQYNSIRLNPITFSVDDAKALTGVSV